jgi:hypothetical protein
MDDTRCGVCGAHPSGLTRPCSACNRKPAEDEYEVLQFQFDSSLRKLVGEFEKRGLEAGEIVGAMTLVEHDVLQRPETP